MKITNTQILSCKYDYGEGLLHKHACCVSV